MLRFLADENFHGGVVRAVRLHRPDVDLVRVQEVGLAGADDPTVLAWAAANDRIVVSRDRATMPDFAYARIEGGEPMPGVFIFRRGLTVGQAADELILLAEASESHEWNGRVVRVPL